MRWLATAFAAFWIAGAVAAPAGARPIWEKRPPYGREMMTPAERRIYWKEFLALETDAERDAYWDAHVEKMQQRAMARGLPIPDLPRNLPGGESEVVYWRAPYFPEVMTPEEREAYVPTLDSIPDRLDRWRFVAAHIRTMYARGLERGLSVPPTTEFANVFEALGELPPDAPEAGADAGPPGGDGFRDPIEEDLGAAGATEDEAEAPGNGGS